MALANDFKVKNGLTVIDSISAGGNLSASEGFFDSDVGLGTNNPAKKLHVLNSTNEAQIRLGQSGSGSYDLGVYANDTFSIGRDADTQEFNIKSGNVGIGTTTPTEKLNVKGNIALSGASTSAGPHLKLEGTYTTWELENQYTGGATNDMFRIRNTQLGSDALVINRLTNNVGIGITDPDQALEIGGGGKLKLSRADNARSLLLYTDNNFATVESDTDPFLLKSADRIQFEANGAERMRINSSGNVGIGTTNPSHLLHVCAADGVAVDSYISLVQNAEATAGDNFGLKVQAGRNSSDVTMEVSNAVGTSYMRVRGDGNVGIGTTSPATILDLDDGTLSDIRIRGNATTDVRFAGIAFYNTAGSDTVAAVNVDRDGANDAGALTFDTQPAGGGVTERMRVTSSGNVGIGMTSPLRKLDLSTSSTTDAVRIKNTDSNGGGLSVFAANGGAGTNRILTLGDASENVKVAVLENGNVGIGTTAPDNKLTVSGAISATGNISTTGNILSAGVNIDQLFGTSGGGDITAVTTGPYLTGGGASGSVEVGIDSACAAAWDAAVAGDISAVVAGTGLTGGGNSGSVTLNISAGDGVQATANCVSVDSTVVRTTGTQTIGGAKTFTSNACFSTGSASAPGITFCDDTDTGLTRNTGTLCFVTDGTSRAHVTSAGVFSQANVYTGSGSSFRNFSGRWNGTTGTTGCGFRFENTVDGVTLDISSTGDTCVYGSLSAQDEVIGECIIKRGGTSSQFLKADGSVDSTSYGIGDITAVTAGTGLTGGGTSGSVTLNLSAGDGVQATANCVSVDSTVVRTTGSQTIAGSKTFSDSAQLRLGSGNDLRLYHATDSYISNEGSGHLYIQNLSDDSDIVFRSDDGSGGTATYFSVDGSAELNRFAKNVMYNDNVVNYFGGGFDLQIYHDSTDSIISNGTGDLHIINSADDKDVVISSDNGAGGTTTYFRADGSTGSASMAHYGTTKLQTSSTGITVAGNSLVTGDSTIYGNLSVTGDFTCLETTVSTTSALSVTNTGTGPALYVCQAGTQPIAHFIDANGDDIVFNDNGCVGIGTTIPAYKLEIADDTNSTVDLLRLRNSDTSYSQSWDFQLDTSKDLVITGGSGSGGVKIVPGTRGFTVNGDIDATGAYDMDGTNIINTSRDFVGRNVDLGDSCCILLGASDDLQIYHDGSNSYLQNVTGDLYIQNGANDKDVILRSDDGSGGQTAYLTLDGSSTGLTVSAPQGMVFFDNIKAKFGNNDDLQIYHDGSNSYIDNGTGNLTIDSGVHLLARTAAGESLANFYANGANELFYDNSKKFETAINGVKLNGTNTYIFGGDNEILAGQDGNGYYFATGNGQNLTKPVNIGDNNSYIRFKSGDSERMRILSGGNVGIGTLTPTAKLTLSGSGDNIPMLEISNATNGGGAAIHFSDNAAGGMAGQTGGLVYCHQDSKSQGGAASFTLSSTESDLAIIAGTASKTARHVVKSANSVGEVDYGFYDDINTGLYQSSNNAAGLVSNGSEKLRVNSNGVQLCDELFVPTNIVHTGDTNTCIGFADDNINLIAGGENGITVNTSGVVINQDGNANDFRVEGDTNISLLHTKGGTDRVGIRCSAPAYELDVNGSINTTSNLLSGGVNLDTLFIKSASAGVTSITAGTGLDGGTITSTGTISLNEATATTRGGIELFSNTDQSEAANSVTSTASRTYGIQLNSAGQAVVNVPWCNTNSGGTVTNVAGCDGITTSNGTGSACVCVDSTVIRTSGGQTIDNTLVISSGTSGDANLCIVSDTDNNNEDDTGCILFVQDGGATQAAIGQNGASSQYTGALANAAYFGSIGNNPVQFIQSDTARLTIENGGNVGIGITNPTYKFQVTSADANDDVAYIHHDNASQSSGTVLKVRSDAGDSSGYSLLDVQNNTGNALYVGGNRSVGIGTTSPASRLQVSGGAQASGTLAAFGNDSTGFSGHGMEMRVIGGVGSLLSYNRSTNTQMPVEIGGSYVMFDVGGVEKMRINTSGNVGIGCTNPTQKLAVAGDGLFTSNLTVQGSLSVLGDFTCLETTVSLTSAMDITNHGTGPALLVNQTGSNDIVNFQDDGTSAFYIEDGGNVGIGCTNPTQKLDVNGSIITAASNSISNGGKIIMQADGTLDWGNSADYGTLTWDTGYAIMKGQSGNGLKFFTNNNGLALTLDTSQHATFAGDVNVCGGDITLGGTGRIQGIDTVSANTDATNKLYVDNCIAAIPTGDITAVNAGAGLCGGGTTGSVTLCHCDTSSQGSVNNSNGCVIQDVTLDGFGHVTALGSTNLDSRYFTETESDARFLPIAGCAANSALLDGIDSSQFLRSDAADTASGTINFSGDICVGDQILHTGDSDTYLQFVGANDFRVVAGNRDNLRVKQAEVIINEASNDVDFRVESNSCSSMLFVDGGNNRVGIGTSSPSATLAVNGSFTATCKSFLVDNPVTGGQLKYGVVEGNEHGVTVRGSTCCGTIDLPTEWDWLVEEDSVTAQLTPVGGPHQPYIVSQDNKQVVVCSDGCYNYNIYGTRKDVEPLEVNIL